MVSKTTKGGMQVFFHNDWTNYDEVMNQIRIVVENWHFESDGKPHSGLESVKQVVRTLKGLTPKGRKQIGLESKKKETKNEEN